MSEHKIVENKICELQDILPVLGTIERDLINKSTDMEFLAQTIWLCRKAEEALKAIKSKIESIGEAAEKEANLNFSMSGSPRYSTGCCTISPISNNILKYPSSPRDENFLEFVKQLPPEAVRPHYPTVCELVLKSHSEGKGLPFGLKAENITGYELKCRVTSKRELQREEP